MAPDLPPVQQGKWDRQVHLSDAKARFMSVQYLTVPGVFIYQKLLLEHISLAHLKDQKYIKHVLGFL